jgi:hypothetical protein
MPIDMTRPKSKVVKNGAVTVTYRIPFPGTWAVILRPIDGIFLETLKNSEPIPGGNFLILRSKIFW